MLEVLPAASAELVIKLAAVRSGSGSPPMVLSGASVEVRMATDSMGVDVSASGDVRLASSDSSVTPAPASLLLPVAASVPVGDSEAVSVAVVVVPRVDIFVPVLLLASKMLLTRAVPRLEVVMLVAVLLAVLLLVEETLL